MGNIKLNKGNEMIQKVQLPEPYQKNIAQAIEILKEAGCTEIYLFGSLATGEIREGSDIDLAVKGCPDEKFFRVWGKLLQTLDYSVDLLDLDDEQDAFVNFLQATEELLQIA